MQVSNRYIKNKIKHTVVAVIASNFIKDELKK